MTVRLSDHAPEMLYTPGNTFRVLDDGTTNGGRVGVVECTLDPGWPGPPQHVHREHDEAFYVIEGRVRFASGDNEFVAMPGDTVTVAAGDPHTFGNADADKPARLVGICSSAEFIGFFRELASLPSDANGRANPADVIALMDQYASHPYVAA